MPPPKNKGSIRNSLWRIVDVIIAIIVVAYIIPDAKHTLFPDRMTRLEKLLRCSVMNGYQLAVDRNSESKITLTVYNGDQSITTEIYKDELREIESSGISQNFFAYSINDNAQGVAYLTRTKIEADADLKQIRRLEVTVCGRLADQHAGVTRFDGYEPVYECEVPVREAVCLAAKPAGTSQ